MVRGFIGASQRLRRFLSTTSSARTANNSSTTTHLRRADFDKQVWVNGKGITYEVARKVDHSESSTCGFHWRISQADLKAPGGCFSQIANVDRILILLKGTDVSLNVNGTDKRLQLNEPFLFPADVDTECTMSGSQTGTDLNIMYNRNTCNTFVRVVSGAGAVPIPCGTETAFVIALDGAVEIVEDSEGGRKPHVVPRTEALKFDNPSQNDIIRIGEGEGESTTSTSACVVCFVPSPKYM